MKILLSDVFFVRLTPDADWRTQTYRIEGNSIFWHSNGAEYLWSPICSEDLPEWWIQMLAQAHEWMDERELKAK